MSFNVAADEEKAQSQLTHVRRDARAFAAPLALAVLAALCWAASPRLSGSHASTPPTATGALLSSAPAASATITVTNTKDSGPGSLRQAISEARSGDTIDFAPGVTGTITLESQLTIDKSLTIVGPGAARLSLFGSASGIRIFDVRSGNVVKISGLTVSRGFATSGEDGGGIRNAGTLEVDRSNIIQNASQGACAGISNTGILTVKNSLIANNLALNGQGGGICAGGIMTSATIINCTITGNRATGGGGVTGNNVSIISSTIADNRADLQPGGLGGGVFGNTDTNIRNSIVAYNSATMEGQDVSGPIKSDGHNIIGRLSPGDGFMSGSNDRVNVEPRLGPLKDNGGPLPTFAPIAESPAVDAGDDSVVAEFGLTTDQRGFPRQFKDHVDIGAVEVQPLIVSGRVSGAGGTGIGGVTLTLSGTRTIVSVTDADGRYSFNSVAPASKFTLIPSKPSFEFAPPLISIENLSASLRDVDFNATPLPTPTPTPDRSDDFDKDNGIFNAGLLSRDPASFNPSSGITIDGKLRFTPAKFAGDSFTGCVAKNDINLNVTTSISVKVEEALAGNGAQTIFSVGKDQENFFGFRVGSLPGGAASSAKASGTDTVRDIIFEVVLNGCKKEGDCKSLNVPYEPGKHAYWRIRFDAPASEVVFETSEKGNNWAAPCTPASDCRFKVNLDSTQVVSQLLAGTTGQINDPGTAVFDDYKVAEPTGLQINERIIDVPETEDNIEIMLSRTGGADSPASVDYAVSAGPSTGPLCIPNAPLPSGTVPFGAGEMNKKLTIKNPLCNDTLRTGNRSLSLRLSRPLGGALDPDGSTATLTVTDDEFTGNVIDDPDFFTKQQYRDFLNRCADADGFNHWIQNFVNCNSEAQCLKREQVHVSGAFFLSIEFQQTGYFVYRIYQASFGRMPTRDELMRDMKTVRGDVIVNRGEWEKELEANKRRFLDAWIERAAFKEKYDPVNSGEFVDAVYRNAGVALSPERRAGLVINLLTNQTTRRKVFGGLIDSHAQADPSECARINSHTQPDTLEFCESKQFREGHFNRAFVLMQYFGYLQRDPDTPGFQFWLSKLDSFHGDFIAAEMVKAFINSDEYRNRFTGKESASCVGSQ